MQPLFRRVSPYVDCLSTETFIKRLYGRSISAVVGASLEISASEATKLTWYGASVSLFNRLSRRITEWASAQKLDVEDLAKDRAGLISGYLGSMPEVNASPWTLTSQQYFSDLAILEADLQLAAAAGDISRAREAMAKSGVGQYVAMIPRQGYAEWSELNFFKKLRDESTGHYRLLALIGIALLDHELRVAVWPEHEPRPVFAPLLPQYRLTPQDKAKGDPVRPERRLLDMMFFACTGKTASPTNEELFPSNTENMAKKVQRATLSAGEYYAIVRDWPALPEPQPDQQGNNTNKEQVAAKERAVFEACFFASKSFGLLFDRTKRTKRHLTIPQMQQNYYVVWESILDKSPHFAGGSHPWDRTRLQRLIRDEIRFT